MMWSMEIERECKQCGKRWMVVVPERGALPLYCSRSCLAKAWRERRAGRDASVAEAIAEAIAHLEARRIAAALSVLSEAQHLIEGKRTTERGRKE